MSFISTLVKCSQCGTVNNTAFLLPDGNVSAYPDTNIYTIGKIEKIGDSFNLLFNCKNCEATIRKVYTKAEFNSIDYTILE